MKQIVILLLIASCFIPGCSNFNNESIIVDDFATIRCQPTAMDVTVKSHDFTIGMTGDILLHHPLNKYTNYDESFSAVKEELMGIDFLLANQESMPGGIELGLSGYPRFNSPKHIIRDLKANGIDMLSIANNHTMDLSENGLLKTISHMKEYGMSYVGAYESLEDSETKRIVEVKGVRIGVLAYTYGLNGLTIPRGKDYLVSLIDRTRMERDIRELKQDADVIVVSIHWGDEYSLLPSNSQKELASWLAEEGVDIIFGHHPHVLQQYSQIGKTQIFYSLGNFYSAQQFDSTNIGGIGKVKVSQKEFAGRSFTEVGDASFFPTAVIRDEEKRFVVVPLHNAEVEYNEKWVKEQVGVTLDK